ncbi:hypothetical protein RFI_09989 [Reticulomyxa filosa]|uniref:TsaA-like domain-containing protein n=1 Tax=Reticulomyxa filosa TaxID=46433 RepID=X6NMA1_RETFI|nr:hypothetical protein RFI_09989 [Reticulomyxa filosa]|eukprot:ETO27146.1 hypothetical protein RFI_09989 [Reticulomyxa filosa]
MKAKIRPPRLQGDKVGVLSSRSPHRLNPIGFTLVKIDKVVDNQLWVSGVDLVHDTPVVDIKPLVLQDLPDKSSFPDWIREKHDVFTVQWLEMAETDLQCLMNEYPLQFYQPNEVHIVKQAITNVLQLDIRSLHSKHKHGDESLFAFQFDCLIVDFMVFPDSRTLYVCRIQHENKSEFKPNCSNRFASHLEFLKRTLRLDAIRTMQNAAQNSKT